MKVTFLVSGLGVEGDPMGVMQLSALAKRQRHKTSLAMASKDYLSEISRARPDLICVSMMSSQYTVLRRAMEAIRRRFPELPMLVGGPHPTFVPTCLDELPVDGACVGEGDEAFLEVLEHLEAGRDLDGILNIQTPTCQTGLRPLIEDLDSLPFLDRELVYQNSPAMRAFKLRSFYTTRGCPFNCTYCFNHAYNRMYKGLGKIVRRRSVDNVLEEMEQVVARYPTEFIRISDDSFLLRRDEWLEEFARKYPRRVGLPFYCLLRCEVVTPEVVHLLKQAGCVSVCMSIESGTESIRREVLNRKVGNQTIIHAFDLFNQAGINIYTNSMVGLPGAGLAEELETLDLNIRCRPAYGNFTICVPFPGTRMFAYCQEHGLLPQELTMDQVNQSTGQLSMLSGFSDLDKRRQKNIALLVPLAINWPSLRNLVVNHLIDLPTNPLYLGAHFLVKNYLFKKKIVTIPFSIGDFLVLGWAQFKNELTLMKDRGKRS